MSKTVLFITRDLSYPGGSERFIVELMKHLATTYKTRLKIKLLETEGSGKFVNTGIYQELKEAGVEHLPALKDKGLALDLKKILPLQKHLQSADLIFTFLFNSDFLTHQALHGNTAIQYFIRSYTNNKKLFKAIPELNEYLNTEIKGLKTLPIWISIKFCDFSIALERETNEWRDRKKIIDDELEPIIAAKHKLIIAVASNVESKWKQWNKQVQRIPCTSISKQDLIQINQDARRRNILRAKYDLNKNAMIVLSVSRIEPGKGVRKLLAAFEKLKGNNNTQLLIVGSGSLLESLKEKYAAQNIKFLGQRDRSEVLELMSLSDIFCILSESEGLPLSLQEAMASSLPVIATNVGGIKDLVKEGVNGYLIDKDFNYDEISNILQSFAGINKVKKSQMADASKQIIQTEFTNDKAFQKYCDLIEKFL